MTQMVLLLFALILAAFIGLAIKKPRYRKCVVVPLVLAGLCALPGIVVGVSHPSDMRAYAILTASAILTPFVFVGSLLLALIIEAVRKPKAPTPATPQ